MNIGIIDAEIIGKSKHRFPNLVCMKLSSYYKQLGNNVDLVLNYDDINKYDKIFISKVFIKTDIPMEPNDKTLKTESSIVNFYKDNEFLKKPNVEYGGTGFFYDKAPQLPYDIEHSKPDYTLYNSWVEDRIKNGAKEKEFVYYKDYSIGFVTRGCFRQCEFCVNKNHTQCLKHSNLDEFMDINRPKLCFLDDNFFACSDWKKIIAEVKSTKKKFQFKQGLDERLLTEEKIDEMATWKYDGDFIFAFDNIEDAELIEKNAKYLKCKIGLKKQNIKFYVFCGFDRDGLYDESFYKQDIIDLFKRIFILAKYDFKPYIMRHENYNNSPYRGTYINVAMWCNQPNLFFTMSYHDVCKKDDDRRGGLQTSSTWKYHDIMFNKYKDIAEEYFYKSPNKIFKKWR